MIREPGPCTVRGRRSCIHPIWTESRQRECGLTISSAPPPVCSPARASLLTGTIPSAHGVHDWLRSGNVDGEKFAAQGKENPYGGYVSERKPIAYLEGQTAYRYTGGKRIPMRPFREMASGGQRSDAARFFQMVHHRERRSLLLSSGYCGERKYYGGARQVYHGDHHG